MNSSCEDSNFAPLANLITPYTLFGSEMKRFIALSKPKLESASREQSYHLLYKKGAVNINIKADVDNGIWNRPNLLNASVPFFTFHYLNQIASITSKNILHSAGSLEDGFKGRATDKQHSNSASVFSGNCACGDTLLTSPTFSLM